MQKGLFYYDTLLKYFIFTNIIQRPIVKCPSEQL
jgi:hypothetical protein